MIQGHGGNIFAAAELVGCRSEEIVDMSSNINPLGMLPGLLDHLRARLDCIGVLPEVDGGRAVAAMADLLGVDGARILAGGGTTQFIYSACAALGTRQPLIVGPTYADYTDGCLVHDLEPDFFLAGEAEGFALDVERLEQRIAGHDTVFLCNPNNPTGHLVPHDELEALCRRHRTTRFIIDESYLPFAPDGRATSLCTSALDNVAVLWSVSKIFGIPGLRAGFLVASPAMVDRFRKYMQPWCVNSLAQEAVHFVGANRPLVEDFLHRTRACLAHEGALLRQRLTGSPYTLLPSATSYFLIRLPAWLTAEEVWRHLAAKRILVRNCANFYGLDHRFIRIALKQPETNRAVAGHLLALAGSGRST